MTFKRILSLVPVTTHQATSGAPHALASHLSDGSRQGQTKFLPPTLVVVPPVQPFGAPRGLGQTGKSANA